MQETKTPRDPKKSLWASYAIIFVVVLLFNALLLPSFARMGVQQVDYGTFLQMLEGGELTTVQLDDTEILFSDTENRLYSTNAIAQDLDIVNRLEAAASSLTRWWTPPACLTICSTSSSCSCR